MSPALEQIDSSSGAIGNAVNHAISDLVTIIASAPAERKTREEWLERLWAAHEADAIPYIETLADYWGELCGSTEVASEWADRPVGTTRMALGPDPHMRGYFHGTSACLSALFRAERYAEIIELLRGEKFWDYAQWAVKAFAARGEKAEAIRYADSCRHPSTPDAAVDRICEEILLSSGLADEAYARYGRSANRRGTYLATFRAVSRKHPHKQPAEILADLITDTPGEEGRWFAAAKESKFYDLALDLARRSPCDPRTLARAARDFADRLPAFAVEAGVLSLHWIVEGHGYDVTGREVLNVFSHVMRAAEANGTTTETRQRIKSLMAHDVPDGPELSVRDRGGKSKSRRAGRAHAPPSACRGARDRAGSRRERLAGRCDPAGEGPPDHTRGDCGGSDSSPDGRSGAFWCALRAAHRRRPDSATGRLPRNAVVAVTRTRA